MPINSWGYYRAYPPEWDKFFGDVRAARPSTDALGAAQDEIVSVARGLILSLSKDDSGHLADGCG